MDFVVNVYEVALSRAVFNNVRPKQLASNELHYELAQLRYCFFGLSKLEEPPVSMNLPLSNTVKNVN